MGRRRDDPRDQKAKGFPGRRKSKTQAALVKMEKAAARDAQLFAAAGEGKDLQALPIFLEDKRLAAASTIWRDYAPRLDKLWLLSTLDRLTFAMFCIYAAEFVIANREILDRGYSLPVPTIAKGRDGKPGEMLRENPAVGRRDYAADMMLKLAEKFGLTPHDRHKLIRDHAMRADDMTLFNRAGRSEQQRPAAADDKPDEQQQPSSAIGTLDQLDSEPPRTVN